MQKNGMKITVKQSNDISMFLDGIFEYAIFSLIAIIFFIIKYGFDWIFVLIFAIPLLVFLLIALIVKTILSNRYFKIDTSMDLFEVRRCFRVKTYSISDICLKVKIQVDNEKDFLCKMKFYNENKKIYSVYNKALVPHGFSEKSFYEKLVQHINVLEI